MGFRFRKSVKAGPFRMTFSKSGIGYSIGGKGFRVTKKAGGGTRTTASIPGTGISYVTDHGKGRKKATISTTAHPLSACLPTKRKWVAFTLCLFLGVLGVHRFYVGKAGTGILWLYSCGLFGIGWIADCISILKGSFQDKFGQSLV